MSYCTYADIVAHTGTELQQAVVEALIADADRRINARLRAGGIVPMSTADELTAASIALTTAAVITRQRIDGSSPSSVSVGGASMSDNKDALVAQLTREAEELLTSYISGLRGDMIDPDPTRVDAGPCREWI